MQFRPLNYARVFPNAAGLSVLFSHAYILKEAGCEHSNNQYPVD
jgi:hypothetical protein